MEPAVDELLALASQVAMGIALAACAGLRAFLPLLVTGLAGRFGLLDLAPRFDWLASDAALIALAVAVAAELLGDKIPAVDHALDVVATFVKPAAGAVLAAGVLTGLEPLPATVLGLVAGGGVAGVVHVAKAKLRLASSVTTLGFGNPLLSVIEDVGALAGSLFAILVPLLALLALLAAATGLALAFARWRRRHSPP